MSIKRELEMATEYLRKRLAETKDALNVNLGTPYQAKGNEYLKKKVSETEEAIELIGKIMVSKEVTEKWIDKKAKEMCKIANVEFFMYAQDFVRSIVEEIRCVA